MLIIFDLDDTLVATTKTLTPILMKKALVQIQMQGGEFPLEEGWKELERINKEVSSGESALKEFIKKYKLDSNLLAIACKEVYEGDIMDLDIDPFPGVLSLLQELKKTSTLALVSKGIYSRQLLKMKKAGIDTLLFDKIEILEQGSKKKKYRSLCKEFLVSPEDVLVVGDRVQVDLLPAKELGCWTVHVCQGREAKAKSEIIDFSVENVEEVRFIYDELQDKKKRGSNSE